MMNRIGNVCTMMMILTLSCIFFSSSSVDDNKAACLASNFLSRSL